MSSTKKVDIDVKVNADTAQAAVAEQAIDSIRTAADKHSASTDAGTKAVDGLGSSLGILTQQTDKASAGISLAAASATGNINGIAAAVAGLSKAAGPIMLIITAAFAAFQGGVKLSNWLWKKFAGDIKEVEPIVIKTREEFDKLNKVKLETLQEEIATIRKDAEAVMSTIDRAVSRATALRNAQAAAEKARILAEEPEGPERDLKLAALEKRTEEANLADQEKAARTKLEELAKQEAAIRARLAEAEKADQELQGRSARAIERQNADRAAGTVNTTLLDRAVQLLDEAQSSAASLAALRGQLEPQLASIGESRADAQNQLAITGAQRSTTGSTYSATVSTIGQQQAEAAAKAKAAATREQMQARLAAAAEQEALIKQQQRDELPGLQTRAEREQADVAAADQSISQFKATSRYAPQSHSYQTQLRELESIREKEQAEAEAAIATARATAQALGQALRSVTTEIQNIKENIANLEN
jgi:hypothetical protein